jgi:Domain of unknown function (DUF4265)
VIKHEGHSTFRLIFKEELTIFKQFEAITPLHELGCHFDKALYNMFAINVPPQTDLAQVVKLLKQGEEKGIWEYEEGYIHRGNGDASH